ncbi:MAG: hypothetical protein LBP53_03735 [Candidatus Peribacteria bacterium]|nr:hypothetical protein [Candidatus Peribacteria bacterium]
MYEDQAMYQILQEQEEKNKVTQELVALVAGNTEAEKEMRNICGSYSLSELLQVKDAIQVDGDDFVIGGKVKFRKMFEISGKVKKQEKQYSDTDRSKYIDKEYRKIQYQDMYQTWELLKEMLKPFKIRENNLWKRWKEE